METRSVHSRASWPIAAHSMSIPASELERLMHAALVRSGASTAMAAATARALAAAEMEGIASHGASRIPQYCGHLRNGRAKGSAVAVVRRDAKAACLVDAKQGLAFEACALAGREAIRRAKEFGVAYVAVTNSNHFGVTAYHLEAIAEAGLVGIAFGKSPATRHGPPRNPPGGARRQRCVFRAGRDAHRRDVGGAGGAPARRGRAAHPAAGAARWRAHSRRSHGEDPRSCRRIPCLKAAYSSKHSRRACARRSQHSASLQATPT